MRFKKTKRSARIMAFLLAVGVTVTSSHALWASPRKVYTPQKGTVPRSRILFQAPQNMTDYKTVDLSTLDNQLNNPSFDKTIVDESAGWKGGLRAEDWQYVWRPQKENTPDDYLATVTDDTVKAFFTHSASELRLGLTQKNVPLKAGQKYVVAYRIKTVDYSSKAGAAARLQAFDADSKKVGEAAYPDALTKIKGNQDWTEVRGIYTAPATASHCDFTLLRETGSGSVYFDDIVFAPLEKTPDSSTTPEAEPTPDVKADLTGASETITEHNLVSNPGFEDTTAQHAEYTGEGPIDWSHTWIPKGKDSAYALEVIDDGSGTNKIIKMKSGTTPLRASISQSFPLNDITSAYQLRFDMHTIGLKGGSGARARVTWYSDLEQKQQISYLETIAKRGDSPWTSYTLDIEKGEIPANTVSARVALFTDTSGNGALGEVYFDSIYFGPPIDEDKDDTFLPDQKPEEDMTLAMDKIHVPSMRGFSYKVMNESIAKNDRGFIVPLAPGTTEIQVFDSSNTKVHSFTLHVASHPENNFDKMRKAWAHTDAGNDAFDPNEAQMVQNFESLEDRVKTYIETANMESDRTYIWDSHKFEGVADRPYSVSVRYGFLRLDEMARAVSNPASAYYMDLDTIRFIRDNLLWLNQQHYHRGLQPRGNWWNYEIGASRHINNIFAHLYAFFTDEEIDQLTDAINYYVPDPGYSQALFQGPRVNKIFGANQVDIGMAKIICGVLREDNDQIKEASEAIREVLPLVDSGNGFYPDGSYLDHGGKNNRPVSYNGAYGLVLIDGLSKIVPIIQMSENPWDEADLDIVYFWFQEAYLPLMYKGEFMDMTRGRSKSREKEQPHDKQVMVFRPALRIANMGDGKDPRQLALKKIIKSQVQSDTYFDIFTSLKGYGDYQAMKELLADTSISGDATDTYIKLYNSMDKFVYFNAERDFALGISMYSDRTQNYEDMNDENRQGWYEGDGMAYLYNADLGHYSENYRPTVDPYRFPGTTVLVEPRVDGSGETYLPGSFVGMTQMDNHLATLAMDFTNWNHALRAKKAWFVLGDKVVFLGAGIEGPNDGRTIETTIENRKMSDLPYNYYVDGNKLDLALDQGEETLASAESFFMEGPGQNYNIGYAFLDKSDLKVKSETRQGAWKNINYGQSAQTVRDKYLTLWQNHDKDHDSYAYVLYPNHSKAEFDSATRKQSVSLLENNDKIQAVYDETLKTWGVVKYDNTPYKLDEALTLTGAGIYVVRENKDKSWDISYLDPVNKQSLSEVEAPVFSAEDYEITYRDSQGLKDITSGARLTYIGKETDETTSTSKIPETSATTEPNKTTESATTPGSKQHLAILEGEELNLLPGDHARFKVNGDLTDLLEVRVNNQVLFRKGDPYEKPQVYKLEQGSTILTLDKAYLETLPLGKAIEVKMTFQEGSAIKAGQVLMHVTIIGKSSENPPVTQTGDRGLGTILLGLSLTAAAALSLSYKKKVGSVSEDK